RRKNLPQQFAEPLQSSTRRWRRRLQTLEEASELSLASLLYRFDDFSALRKRLKPARVWIPAVVFYGFRQFQMLVDIVMSLKNSNRTARGRHPPRSVCDNHARISDVCDRPMRGTFPLPVFAFILGIG